MSATITARHAPRRASATTPLTGATRHGDAPRGSSYLPARFGIRVTVQHDALWRVTRHGGEVLGYISVDETSAEQRYRARRLLPRNARFLDLGSFSAFDDAIECFRLG